MQLIRTPDQIALTPEEVEAIIKDYVERESGRQVDSSRYICNDKLMGAVLILKHSDEETKPVNLR